jgi:hypothetical protein
MARIDAMSSSAIWGGPSGQPSADGALRVDLRAPVPKIGLGVGPYLDRVGAQPAQSDDHGGGTVPVEVEVRLVRRRAGR